MRLYQLDTVLFLLGFIIRGNGCGMVINGNLTNKSLTEQVIFAFINIRIPFI